MRDELARIDRGDGLLFDDVPRLYDRYRPGYPSAAIDDLMALSGTSRGSRVLEIGAGTGQATMLLVDRGMRVTAVEPGHRMAARLARRLRRARESRVVIATFERAELPDERYELVVSATAFHWVHPARRYLLAAGALRRDGALALLRNDAVAGPGSAEYYRLMEPVCSEEAPGLTGCPAAASELPDVSTEVRESGLFRVVGERRYFWDRGYETREFIGLVQTSATHRALTPAKQARLIARIREVMDDRLGGAVTEHYVTTLCVARRV